MTAGPVLLLDGFSLLYRAFFALPPMNTRTGEPTSALYGFCALLLKLWREHRPRGAAVALDRSAPTFRHAAFAGYKASRPRAPTPLTQQIDRLDEVLTAFGFPVHAVSGFEADDVLATLAAELRVANLPALIVTGDLDALQCALGSTRVHVVSRGAGEGQTYDEAAVWARYGVSPAELPDWKALAGDPTDELPGVPGIGAKTASALVRRFGGVGGLLAHLDEVTPERLRTTLAERAEHLPLWRDLARVRADVGLPEGERWRPLADIDRVRALFERFEFKSLLARLASISVTSE